LARNKSVVREFLAAALKQGGELPGLERFAELKAHDSAIRKLLAQPDRTPETVQRIRRELEQALTINPHDPEALRAAAGFYERANDPKTAAAMFKRLAAVEPADAEAWAGLGKALYRSEEWEDAERALGRAREMKPGDAVIAEQLGRIRLRHGASADALELFEESLKANPKNQDLWFLKADTEMKRGDRKGAAESGERGLELGGDHLERRTALIAWYLEDGRKDAALQHVQAALPTLPAAPEIRSRYAGFLEQLGRPEEALRLWEDALRGAPKMEQAYYAVGHLKFERGDLKGASEAAVAGIEAAPDSARLRLLQADVLERQGEVYAARNILREAAERTGDLDALRRNANMQDRFGPSAGAAYLALDAALQKSAPQSEEHIHAIERGLAVSLRDDDSQKAAAFASQLRAEGRGDPAPALQPAGPAPNEVWIRGGLDALAFIAHGKAKPSREHFFAEYCRAIVRWTTNVDQKRAAKYIEGIRDYFQRLFALVGSAARGNRTTITLSVANEGERAETERILGLLGWKLRNSKEGVKVEAGENVSLARRQETASALTIDEVGMQEALQARRPFSFNVPYERALIVPDEKVWHAQFYPNENLAGGFAEAVARDPRIAKVYLGLSALDNATRSALLAGVGLKRLTEEYGDVLYYYSSALASGPEGIVVPGGVQAEPIWTRLIGASPREPARFLPMLLNKDSGKAFAFFATISELDSEHQQFFTRTAGRTASFYELFREAPEMRRGASRLLKTASFAQFLREVPLDDEGHVEFPGSPEVWMLAKGTSGSTASTAKMLRKLARTAVPEVEDEILLRLARTRYIAESSQRSELDNFLAVARIDRHREEPLDEGSALMLAQHYVEYSPAYPYFAVLTGLEQPDFRQFFKFGESLHQHDTTWVENALGDWNALVEILCVAQGAGAIDSKQAAGLFRTLTERFEKAAAPEDFTAASLEGLRAIFRAAGPAAEGSDAADSARNLLLGRVAPAEFVRGGVAAEIDAGRARHEAFTRVLELQKMTPLDALFHIYDAVTEISSGKGPPARAIPQIDENRAKLIAPDLTKSFKTALNTRSDLDSFRPDKIAGIVARLRQKAARKKVDLKDLDRLAREVLKEICPQVRWTLTGLVYAVFLRPDDLLASDDPLLVRKHEFVELTGQIEKGFQASDLRVSSEQTGSYAVGGFAGFAMTAGSIAAIGARKEDVAARPLITAQLAALRAADYRKLRDEDLRLFALVVQAAREWIVESAARPAVRADLAQSTLGLISLGRRRDVLAALELRDWRTVWESVSLSDLYFLGRRYLRRYASDPWTSPVTAALRQASRNNDGGRLNELGPVLPSLFNCSHPHLLERAPCEEFEKYMFPTRMAERVSELKLYVALRMTAAGIPASAFGALAEPLAREVFRNLHMADERDWSSVLEGFSKIDDAALDRVLAEK
jgi:tetratricopeptide (TPR) repeat protein